MKNSEKQKIPCVNLYLIRDIRSKRWFPPFVAENTDVAMRHCAQMVRNPESTMGQYPQDFSLWQCGDFDPTDGQIDVLDAYDFIIEFSELVSNQQKPELQTV
jgi:hypothetical protein